MALAQRLEREAPDAELKEAVKALHQGLSCLAGQINATDSHSSYVAAQLTNNWEQLARQLGDMRRDFEDARQELEHRLAAAEKNARSNVNALAQTLETIEAFAHQRAIDKVKSQHHAAKQDEIPARLTDSFAKLERRLQDEDLPRRLKNVERAVREVGEQQNRESATEKLFASLKAFDQRIAALEKDHDDLLAALRAKLLQADPPPAHELPPVLDELTQNEPPQTEPTYGAQPGEGFSDAPDFDEIFGQPAEEANNFLTRARLSARAPDPKPRPSYLGLAAVAVVALLALLGGLAAWR